MRTRFSPARCCCSNECYATFVVRDRCTGDPITTGAKVSLYEPGSSTPVAFAYSAVGGRARINLPDGRHTYDVGAYWNCAEILNYGVELSCSTRDYPLTAWNDATTGDQYVYIESMPLQGYPPGYAPCRGSFAGWEVLIDGVKHVFELEDPEAEIPRYRTKWKADVYGKICGTVPAIVDAPFPYQQAAFFDKTVTFEPGCSFLAGYVLIELQDGFACCAHDDNFPTTGAFYQHLQLTDDVDSYKVDGYSICGGAVRRDVIASHSCSQPYLAPTSSGPVGVGTGDVHMMYQWGWDIRRGGWWCDQYVAEFTWSWARPAPGLGGYDQYCQRLRWRDFNGQPVTSEQLESRWVVYPSTSYTIHSHNYQCSISFFWNQTGNWNPVKNLPCPDGEPVSTFLTLTERASPL